MKILLFGKSGQVGWELQRSLAPLGTLIALDADSLDYCADFTQLDAVADTIRAIAPDIIVNAAAHTAVDKAESEAELAHQINAAAPQMLAQEALRLGAWLIHYSTDYVFNGQGTHPWCETDIPSPINVYGQTKLAGEQAIQTSGCKHLIFRTSWVYAARGGNFAKTMLRLAQERDSLSVIHDQIGAPTGADLLADVTAHAIRQVQTAPEKAGLYHGLYHVVAAGETSWHGYASYVIEHARRAGMTIKVASDAIHAVPTSTFQTSATRPLNSRLSTQRFQTTFDLYVPNWQSGVTRMLNKLLCNRALGITH
jgi:dTDP-4-dehydrorhamnose reductase